MQDRLSRNIYTLTATLTDRMLCYSDSTVCYVTLTDSMLCYSDRLFYVTLTDSMLCYSYRQYVMLLGEKGFMVI
jgi:hypothetical protein